MRDEIEACLTKVEEDNDCRVLYACESGSRAWGFASPDSDYDVRFIYAKPREWYLRLDEPADTIEAMLPGDIDLAGWELRKTLRLFQRGNDSLYEWLGSPTVYRADTAFHARLTELIPAYYNPKRSMFHYLRIAEKALGNALSEGTIGIKRLCYVLRPLAACEWIFAKRTMPPTPFATVLAGIELDAEVSSSIETLLMRKREAKEKEAVGIPRALAKWIERGLAQNTARAEEMEPAATQGWGPLNEVMRTLCGPL